MSDPSLVQRKKGLSGCALFVIALMAIAFLLVSLFWVWSLRRDRQFAKRLDEIRDRGEPVTPGELDAFYALPEGAVDTTDLWLEATSPLSTEAYSEDSSELPIVGASESEVPRAGEPWAQLEDAEAFRDRYQPLIDMMHKASERGGAARYPKNFEQSIFMALDEVQQLRSASRLLNLDARIRAHRGDAAGVIRNLNTIFGVGDSLKYEPIIVSQLVRNAIISLGIEEISRAIVEVDFTEAQLKQLQTALSELDTRDGVRRAILGERVFGLTVLRDPMQFADSPMAVWLRFVKPDTEAYLSVMACSQEAAELSFPEAQKMLSDIEAEISGWRGIDQTLPKMLLPSLEGFYSSCVRLEAQCEMAKTGIAIKLFEKQHSRLPTRLAELVPDFVAKQPIDPFDLQPIRYVPDEDGTAFYLFCVGKDGVDSGGIAAEEGMDHVFAVGIEREEGKEESCPLD